MEPMALGSAPSSPASPAANPSFLPAFLMGDAQQASPGASPGRHRAPGQRKLGAEARALGSPLATRQPFTPHRPGPPSTGLFDALEARRPPHSPPRGSPEESCAGRAVGELPGRIDTNWVTVYGFPPSALSLVLAQLSNCGVIVEKRVPAQGNWVHLRYNSVADVPRALALNGRCINNAIMIGVGLHHMETNKENEMNGNVSGMSFTSPTRARSLRQSFISPNTSSSVLPPQSVPQKSTGIMSKAIEYVFGW